MGPLRWVLDGDRTVICEPILHFQLQAESPGQLGLRLEPLAPGLVRVRDSISPDNLAGTTFPLREPALGTKPARPSGRQHCLLAGLCRAARLGRSTASRLGWSNDLLRGRFSATDRQSISFQFS